MISMRIALYCVRAWSGVFTRDGAASAERDDEAGFGNLHNRSSCLLQVTTAYEMSNLMNNNDTAY